MPPLRSTIGRLFPFLKSGTRASAREALASHPTAPPFPVIPTSPAPTCPCSSQPAGLDIDRKASLNGTMPPYAQHVLIPTGRSDWTSRIEDEKHTAVWGRFAAEMKHLLGRGGEFHDPFNNVLLNTSSFTPWELAEREADLERRQGKPTASVQTQKTVDALLFPAFQHVRSLRLEPGSDDLRKLVKSSLLPEEGRLHPIYKDLSESERRAKTRDPAGGDGLVKADIETPTILICSHGQRDHRCGVLGPLLHDEFARYINECRPSKPVRLEARSGSFAATPSMAMTSSSSSSSSSSTEKTEALMTTTVNIGMISHIGGHKWAGNVIVYIPPNFNSFSSDDDDSSLSDLRPRRHPLAGSGVWYGRVEPKDVEGIVEQTLLQGKVIQDLFRGGISRTGSVLRL